MVPAATATTSASTTSTDLSTPEIACSTCLIKFHSKELQREHMKEDWHVYNLKRRIASLPPLSATEFHEQELISKDSTERSSPFQKSCDVCQLHYTNQNAWRAHLKSRNHDQKSNQLVPISLSSDNLLSHGSEQAESSTAERTFNPSQCLFCNSKSESLHENLKHMSQAHSFFIPDPEYLIDMESFLSYLFVLVEEFHECLYCGKEKRTAFAIQEHMREKGHCRFNLDHEREGFDEFWDFEGDEEDEEDEDGELTDDGEGKGKERMVLIPDENELRLPSGKILSHRSQARFSRQHHSTRRPSSPRQEQERLTEAVSEEEPSPANPTSSNRSLALRTRAGASTSLIGVPELQQRALIATEMKVEAKEARKRNEYMFWLERGGNRQKRFRVKSMGKKQGGLEKRLG